MESYLRIGVRVLKNFTYPYMGVRGVKNCQNHPYVINLLIDFVDPPISSPNTPFFSLFVF